ncbi:MAG TPA: hypothetical protein VJ302_25965 [Blastocatellia bacterium]|nr:hypothetical protein [Blastocatellia bacterium]
MTPPDILLPKLGPALTALGCGLLVIFAFLVVWFFGNDLKVGRVLLVSALGDGFKLTKSLLQADPKLPYYRIFSYDALRLAFTLSFGLIPLSVAGIWLARRALRLARTNPARFGGATLARFSLLLSVGLCVIFSAIALISIPDAIERGRAKHRAATSAAMYQLHALALQRYYKEYGSYPQELSDLSRVAAETVSQTDYWQHSFSYVPVGVIASKGSAISFSNYKLVSAGSDGKFGTADDLTMVDGVIVYGQSESDSPAMTLTPEKSR